MDENELKPVNEYEPPLGGHDEIYEIEEEPEPFEGWKIGE